LYKFIKSRGTDNPASAQIESHFAFQPGWRRRKRSTTVRQSHEQLKRDLRHNKLQEALYHQLARQFGKGNVGTELQGANATSIDLVVRRKRDYWFYEIKTAESPRANIREALGQLLEYAFWPGA